MDIKLPLNKLRALVPYTKDNILPDGVYNGLYNSEPALIRIVKGEPVFVSFIGFLDSTGKSSSSSIFDKRGITASNIELLRL